jgi:hypothetical protein
VIRGTSRHNYPYLSCAHTRIYSPVHDDRQDPRGRNKAIQLAYLTSIQHRLMDSSDSLIK